MGGGRRGGVGAGCRDLDRAARRRLTLVLLPQDGSGSINMPEVLETLGQLGALLSEEEVEAFIRVSRQVVGGPLRDFAS